MLSPKVPAMSVVAFHLPDPLPSTIQSATDPQNTFLILQQTISSSFLSTHLRWFHLQHISQICLLSCWDFLKNYSTAFSTVSGSHSNTRLGVSLPSSSASSPCSRRTCYSRRYHS